jgi:hypothetical protein
MQSVGVVFGLVMYRRDPTPIYKSDSYRQFYGVLRAEYSQRYIG